MRTTITISTLLLMTALSFLAGCEEMSLNGQGRKTPVLGSSQDEEEKADYVKDETVLTPDGDASRGATDVAMEWADKYAKTAQELLYANKRIDDLENDKKKLQTQIASLKSELTGYQRELNDANVMLNDMKKDLKEWRANVLGIRKDFIASQNAILASQYKILELLGGEVSRSRFRQPVTSTGPSVDDSQSRAGSSQPNLVSLQGSTP
jgi:peptidoglycan hydrolase CwlO-like protein